MRRRLPVLLLAWALLLPGPALAGQPMDRFQRMIETGKADQVVDQARKWLDKYLVDARREEVIALLHEAAYQALLAKPSVAACRDYVERYPKSERLDDVGKLEANLALYAARDRRSEAELLQVVDRYGGTAAAVEARAMAEEVAFEALAGVPGSDPVADFLSRYRDGKREEEARALWRERLWEEAEAENSAEGWLKLRAADPEHPRAGEAQERESVLALAAVGADAEAGELLKLARRYLPLPAGREALLRGMGASVLSLYVPGGESPAWTGPLDTDPATLPPLEGLARAVVEAPRGTPQGVSLDLSLAWVGADGPIAWEEQAARLAERFRAAPAAEGAGPEPGDVPADAEADVAPAQEGTDGPPAVDPSPDRSFAAPPCRVGGEEGRFELRVAVRADDLFEPRSLPLQVRAECGGTVPLAVRTDPGSGRPIALARRALPAADWQEVALPGLLRETCDGTRTTELGPALACGDRNVWTVDGGLLLRPGAGPATPLPPPTDPSEPTPTPDPGPARFGALVCGHPAALPAPPEGSDPPGLPVPPGEASMEAANGGKEAEAEAADAHGLPGFPPFLAPSFDHRVDLDGDGRAERVARFTEGDGGAEPERSWIVVVEPDRAWLGPWPEGADAAAPPSLERDGCGWRPLGSEDRPAPR